MPDSLTTASCLQIFSCHYTPPGVRGNDDDDDDADDDDEDEG